MSQFRNYDVKLILFELTACTYKMARSVEFNLVVLTINQGTHKWISNDFIDIKLVKQVITVQLLKALALRYKIIFMASSTKHDILTAHKT